MQLVNDLKQRQSLFESALMQKEMEKVMLYQVCRLLLRFFFFIALQPRVE